MRTLDYLKAVTCLLFATSAWGGLFHVGKYALRNLDPFWFTSVRYACASVLILAIISFFGPIRFGLIKRYWPKFLGFGILGYGMFGILVFVGLNMSVPSHGALIMATMPITSLFVSWVLDKKVPEVWAFAVAILAIWGVGLVAGAWSFGSREVGTTLLGDGIALIGTLGWVLYSRGQKSLPNITVLEFTAFTTVLAFPAILLFASFGAFIGFSHVPTATNLLNASSAMLYIVVFGTVLSGLAFNYGVRRLGAHQGIVFINFVPVSAWCISIALGQMPSDAEIIGTVMVMIALVVQAVMVNNKGFIAFFSSQRTQKI